MGFSLRAVDRTAAAAAYKPQVWSVNECMSSHFRMLTDSQVNSRERYTVHSYALLISSGGSIEEQMPATLSDDARHFLIRSMGEALTNTLVRRRRS